MRAERTGRNRNSRRVSIFSRGSGQFIWKTLSQSSILARFQNYSKLEENPEECSVSSLEFASQPVSIPTVSKSHDNINTKVEEEKTGFGDLLGSLSEDPGIPSSSTVNKTLCWKLIGYLNFLHPQIKDFGQWEGNSHHIQLEVSNPLCHELNALSFFSYWSSFFFIRILGATHPRHVTIHQSDRRIGLCQTSLTNHEGVKWSRLRTKIKKSLAPTYLTSKFCN